MRAKATVFKVAVYIVTLYDYPSVSFGIVLLLRSGAETYRVPDAEDRTGVSARGYLARQPAKVAGRFSQIVSGCETMNSPSPLLCLKTNPTGLSLPPQGSQLFRKKKVNGAAALRIIKEKASCLSSLWENDPPEKSSRNKMGSK